MPAPTRSNIRRGRARRRPRCRTRCPRTLKVERLARLQAAIERQQDAFNARCVGRTFDVLFEKAGRQPGQLVGRSPYLQPVQAFAPAAMIGDVVAVTITRTGANSLFGELARTATRDAAAPELAKSGDLRHCATRVGQQSSLPPRGCRRARNAVTQIVLAFDDNRLASVLFGQYGQNLALIERRLGVVAEQRGNHVTLDGSRDACEQARRVLEGLYEQLKRGDELVSGDVEGAIRLAIAQGSLFDFDPATARPSFEEINLRKRPVRARTAAQDAYIRALRRHALVFGAGPAGTGKTWLAVAHAVALCSSARRSTASSCRGRRSRPASGSAFCPATCARRSIPICARSTTRCTI